jgi:hypothetical protein
MPATLVPSAELEVSILNRAFNNQSPSHGVFHPQKVAAGNTPQSWNAFAFQFGSAYQGLTAGELSLKLLGNMGLLPDSGLAGALTSHIEAAGKENVGIIAMQLGHILMGLENATGDQAVYRAAAVAWNNEITAAYVYSTNSANGTPSTARLVGVAEDAAAPADVFA